MPFCQKSGAALYDIDVPVSELLIFSSTHPGSTCPSGAVNWSEDSNVFFAGTSRYIQGAFFRQC